MNSIQLRGLAIPLGTALPTRSGFTEHIATDAFSEMLALDLPCSLLLGSHTGPLIASTDSATLTLIADDDGLYFSADILADVEGFHALGNNRYPQCSVFFGEYHTDEDGIVTKATIEHIALLEDDAAYGGHVGVWVANKEPSSLRVKCLAERWQQAYRNHIHAKTLAPKPAPRPLQRTSPINALPPLGRGWTIIGGKR